MTKITICAIAKNEDRYIEDWLKYHYDLGFTNITIYDNNDSNRKGDLQRLITDSNKLTQEMKNATEIIEINDRHNCQTQVYNEYYNSHNFDWCAYIDIDEFVKLVAWDNIKEMVNDNRFNNTTTIDLAWKTISDDDIVDVPDDFIYNGKKAIDIEDEAEREAAASEWEKIPVYNRLFKETISYEPFANKQIIRGGLSDLEVSIHHYISRSNRNTSFASGKQRKYMPFYAPFTTREYIEDIKFAYINHYRTKTLREFLRQKYLNQSDIANYSARTLFVCDYFFRLNRETSEKLDYYNKHHKPIICNIIVNEKEYDGQRNACDVCYICGQGDKKNSNPFVISYPFLIRHLRYIDVFNII